jgi:hypothetical protein
MTVLDPSAANLHRIQALLDKAESTPFPEEAEALLAKAQELMARDAIDEAMLAASSRNAEEPELTDVVIVPPYASAKLALLGVVGRANRCRTVSVKGPNGAVHATVVGFPGDLSNVRSLYLALSVQATRFMLAAQPPPGETPRRFRHAFLLAFAARIGERLLEAERAAEAEATLAQQAAPGGRSVSLVLASRSAAVDKAFRAAFPHLRHTRVSGSSGAGFASGRAAADRAALGAPALGERRRGLPSG